MEAHTRSIAAVSFTPANEPYYSPLSNRGMGTLLGTIATAGSDSAVKLFNLVGYSSRVGDGDRVSFMEMIEDRFSVDTDEPNGCIIPRLEKKVTCAAPCSCPPGLSRPDGRRCGRCLNRGHTDVVRSVCFNDGLLMSGSYDGTAKVSCMLQRRGAAR